VKSLLRWLLLLPCVAAGSIASVLLYFPIRVGLLDFCPVRSRYFISTTDFTKPNFESTPTLSCSASWYHTADASVMLLAIFFAVVVAGVIGNRVAPIHKTKIGLLSSFLAITSICIFSFIK
jgi:hypothetical protein